MTPAADGPLVSVVVPTLCEEAYLPRLLRDLRDLRVAHEVVVADGDSTDGTAAVARGFGARVVRARGGRGPQLAAGAAAATAPWLFFVHADCRVPPGTLRAVEDWLARAEPGDAAHLAFALEGHGWFWRFLELGQALRERLAGLVYGDQGLILSRTLYDAVDGFPALPIMEDVAMLERVRRRGRLQRLEAPLPTSPRRYRREGRWRAWLRNAALAALFRLGVPPERLVRFYPPEPPREDGPPSHRGQHDLLLVFARAPRPGSVKTRLAADLGPERAAGLYRWMGRRIVDAVREGPWRTVVAYTPADGRSEMVEWLGAEGLEYRPQKGPDLGARMCDAFRSAFRSCRAGRACIIGTDAPDVGEPLVRRAFRHLDAHDLVVGPARDGGYYLLGMRRFRPSLFRDVPWSTSRVLESTLDRAAGAGLSVALLPALVDVDTVEDLPRAGI